MGHGGYNQPSNNRHLLYPLLKTSLYVYPLSGRVCMYESMQMDVHLMYISNVSVTPTRGRWSFNAIWVVARRRLPIARFRPLSDYHCHRFAWLHRACGKLSIYYMQSEVLCRCTPLIPSTLTGVDGPISPARLSSPLATVPVSLRRLDEIPSLTVIRLQCDTNCWSFKICAYHLYTLLGR